MTQNLLDEALKMPPNERIEFAQLIMASIDCENDEIRKLWLDEVKDRRQAVKDERAKLINFENLYHEDYNSGNCPHA
ncbi:MAG: addiction module protein [Proteobacteria bacterium]|nr:addiction module protein [Pseudomonadota bacterium]MBU1387525.1 addiction module protein [Pseudomonadota bacterium]MBU1544000.1 addiction module protein [Pseudomonadota bacterium]